MIELTKLEALCGRLELIDEFTEVYSNMLAQAAARKDTETIKRMRVVLHRQVAFLAVEAIKAKMEENEEIRTTRGEMS